ncbi:MAG: zf-HC2 domain-containing protein [Planctomycetota bacterium]
MKCREVMELHELYLDRALEAGARISLEAHLSGCSSCQKQLEELGTLDARLERAVAPVGDPTFAAEVMHRIRIDHTPAAQPLRRTFSMRSLISHAGIAAAAAVLAIALWPKQGDTEGPIVRWASGNATAAGQLLRRDASFLPGQTLEVAPGGRLAWTDARGTVQQLAPFAGDAARARLESEGVTRLDRGLLTVSAVDPIEIRSPLGSARLEGGTVASLRREDDRGLMMDVHEGRATLEGSDRRLELRAGESGRVVADGPERVLPPEPIDLAPWEAKVDELEAENRKLHERGKGLEQEVLSLTAQLTEALTNNQQLGERLLQIESTVTEAQVQALMDDFETSAQVGMLYPLVAEAIQLAPRFREMGSRGIDLLSEVISTSDSSEQRLLAVLILRRIETPAVIPPLQAALQIKDEAGNMARQIAAAGLSIIDAEAMSSVLRSRFEAENEDIGVRINSAIGLARMGDRPAIDFLVDMYRDESADPRDREGALQALLVANRPEAAPLFREIATDEKVEIGVRAAAFSFLGDVRDQQSLELVQKVADDPAVPAEIRKVAQRAYNRITGTDFYR